MPRALKGPTYRCSYCRLTFRVRPRQLLPVCTLCRRVMHRIDNILTCRDYYAAHREAILARRRAKKALAKLTPPPATTNLA